MHAPVLAGAGGSSPRVRGKPGRPRPPRRGDGLIPACAGKTRALVVVGSSPRVWGKLVVLENAAPCPRLIPACAGKTRQGAGEGAGVGAHPRVCGENSSKDAGIWVATGSSPRVRGKQGPQDLGAQPFVLIPACAGKTGRGRRCRGCPGAHPRVCGENSAADSFVRLTTGSSPRVRGKLREEGLGADDRGLIPACAGKTPGCGGAVVEGWAHPRVCGENST